MPDIGHITVGSECIAPCDSVRNLGIQFDSIFSFEEHIKNICKSSFYHLRNIAKIRKYLTQDTCEILFHAFISSKLDHFKTEFRRGPGRCDTSHLSDFNETWSK